MNVKDYEKFLQFFYEQFHRRTRITRQIMRNISINLCTTKYSLMYGKKGEIKCTTRPLNLIIFYILATRSDIFLGQGEKRPKIINHKQTKLTFMTTFLLSTIIPMLFFPEDNKKTYFIPRKKSYLLEDIISRSRKLSPCGLSTCPDKYGSFSCMNADSDIQEMVKYVWKYNKYKR